MQAGLLRVVSRSDRRKISVGDDGVSHEIDTSDLSLENRKTTPKVWNCQSRPVDGNDDLTLAARSTLG